LDYDPNRTGQDGGKRPASFVLVLAGSLFIIFSLLQLIRLIVGPIRVFEGLNLRPDIIAVGILFMEGSLLIVGGYKLIRGQEEGVAFAWVGWIIGLLLSSVRALVLLSNAFSSVVLSVDGMENWSATEDVVPALYLGLVRIMLLPWLVRLGRSTDNMTDGRSQG